MHQESSSHERRGPVAYMAGNHVAANLLMVVLIVGGILAAMRMKQEVFPDLELDRVQVSVAYPGASPAEVEQSVVLVIEEAVQGLDGVDEVTGSAREGMGTVIVEALVGADIQKLSQDIKNEVDRIRSFPEEIERPEVVLMVQRRQVLSLVIYGDTEERILHEMAEHIRDELLQSENITLVELGSVRPLEISIDVPQEKLRAYNLTLGEIAGRVRQAAIEMPGGGLKTDAGDVLVRMMERRDWGREFADVPVLSRNDGTQVTLGRIADIVDGYEDIDRFASYDGHPAVEINVYRVGDQTPIEVSDTVQEFIAEHKEELPPGIHMAIQNDMSDVYEQRMDLLLRNAYIGLTLVFCLLGLFLEARLAFWVTMGIPISFLGGLLILPAFGLSLNMVSLFAFIIALGIVVDDAIVVGENIYEWHQKGLPFAQAAVRGAREVVMPVTFSILTNILAFLPMFFVPGIMGKIFWIIPGVVCTVFVISLVESLFVLPAHLGHQKDIRGGSIRGYIHGFQQRFSNWLSRMIKNVYGPFLSLALRCRYLTTAVALGILAVVAAYIYSGRMGLEMFPRVESDEAVVTAKLPYGSNVKATEAVRDLLLASAHRVIDAHGGDQLVQGIYARVGSGMAGGGPGGGQAATGGHITSIQVFLQPPGQRPISTEEFIQKWRKETGVIPGLESLSFQSDAGGPGSGAALTIELSHRSLEVLEAVSEEVAEALRQFPNVQDVDDGFTPGKQQFDFTVRPDSQSLGLTAFDVARQVRDAYYGAEVFRQQRGRNEVKIMVRLPKEERISEYDLEELLIRTPAGSEIPLRDAVESTRGRAYTTIDRRNGRRIVSVTADVDPPSQANLVLGEVKATTLPELEEKYSGLSYSFEGKQADMQESIQALMMGLLLALLAIYALLAVAFKSYVQPMIVMTSIPFGIIGAVLGHLVMGYSLSIMSLMGIVALAGVVVNDSLVLIEFANRRLRDGMSPREAIHAAGVRRFRPILLTSLTTFGGLAPMIFETSRQARFLIPMALSLGYGILFATGIVLLLAPCLFLIVEDFRKLLSWLRGGRDEGIDEPTAAPSESLAVESGPSPA